MTISQQIAQKRDQFPRGSRFYFEGKRPNLPPEHQQDIDPYIGGYLDGRDVLESVQEGAFRSGLVGRLVIGGVTAQWYEITCTREDLWGEREWQLTPCQKPQAGEITHYICES